MEWKYIGKFKDRSPHIRAAGTPLKNDGTTKELLKIYPMDDAIVTVLTEAGLRKVPIENPRPKLDFYRHTGVYTQTKALISSPVESHYQTLLRDLKETTWDSYWNKQLGKIRDNSALLPHDKEDLTFGKVSDRKPTLKEVVQPDITPYELAYNDAEYHDMYSKTHNDYYPAEMRSRNYNPPFDKNQRYGVFSKRRSTTACAMTREIQEPLVLANNTLADFIDRRKPRLGKVFEPNQNIKCVPPGHRFGDKSMRLCYSLPELLQPDLINSNFRKDFRIWLQGVIEIRRTFKNKCINLADLRGYCKYADYNASKWLSLRTFQKILSDHNVVVSYHEVLPFAGCFGIFEHGIVQYEKMLDLFDINVQLPDLNRIDDNSTPASKNHYITTYMQERCDGLIKDYSNCPPAGEPSHRDDSLAAILQPSILTTYGLSHDDLFEPRTKEYMKKLFERLGFEFPEDSFQKLWEMSQCIDQNEKVCVDTFRKIMDQAAPLTIKEEPEEPSIESPKRCPDL